MITDEVLVGIFKKMLEIRRFDEKIAELYARGMVPYDPHLSIGQEAIASGVCANLRKDDYVLSTHRSHAHSIAKGVPLNELAAEILGKKTGCCRGRGGTMRPVRVDLGLLYSSPIVGSNIPIAAGVGLAIKLRETDQVVVCFFGDGAANIGDFHEGLNLASIWKLPVIFVCENNKYAISVSVERSTSIKNIADRATAYSIPGVTVDGMDAITVYEAAHEAMERARQGEGPTLIECKTYRYRGHDESDPPPWPYRSKEEVEEWRKKDPIEKLKTKLLDMGLLTEETVNRIEQGIARNVEEAINYGIESPYPSPEEVTEYVF